MRDSSGKYIDPDEHFYDFWYTDNTKPGTGYLYVRMYGGSEQTLWFKIYMPASTGLTVENIVATAKQAAALK